MIDYFNTYAPVAWISIIRGLISLVALNHIVVNQMDVKYFFFFFFFNTDIEEEIYIYIYMEHTERFVVPYCERKVCKLIKSLYMA